MAVGWRNRQEEAGRPAEQHLRGGGEHRLGALLLLVDVVQQVGQLLLVGFCVSIIGSGFQYFIGNLELCSQAWIGQL